MTNPDGLALALRVRPEPGLYRWTHLESPAGVANDVRALNWRLFGIDSTIRWDKSAFLTQCAAAFQFPAYYGHNWDALADCLRDVELPQGSGAVVAWRGWGGMARVFPQEFATAAEILDEFARRSDAVTVIGLLLGSGPDVPVPELPRE